ncbi:MAG TPA: sigma-70 family RNA polymerase sigma factor [Catenuloplanes sp.]|jgi:RNA polymerase sigma-70 factor (ECF subfamily)
MGRPPPSRSTPLTDPEVFTAFYRAHVDDVLRFVTRRVADPHTAADITAEVFRAVIESASSFQPERGSPVAWLFGIARHQIAGDNRRRVREAERQQRIAGRRLLDADDIGRLEARIDAAGEVRRLYRQLAELPEPERAVLELVAVDGLSTVEAAQALGIRPGTARVRLLRARRRLRTVLDRPHPIPLDALTTETP